MRKVRIFIKEPFSDSSRIVLDKDNTHYLVSVMRLNIGDKFKCFNSSSGEWTCEILRILKDSLICKATTFLHKAKKLPFLGLAFAPLKANLSNVIVQKATELGISDIYPIFTERTIVKRVNESRLIKISREASEQCGRTDVPNLHKTIQLRNFIAQMHTANSLIFFQELGNPKTFLNIASNTNTIIIIGPEGGFSESEQTILNRYAKSITMGGLVMRAETAAIAAISAYKSLFTWRNELQ